MGLPSTKELVNTTDVTIHFASGLYLGPKSRSVISIKSFDLHNFQIQTDDNDRYFIDYYPTETQIIFYPCIVLVETYLESHTKMFAGYPCKKTYQVINHSTKEALLECSDGIKILLLPSGYKTTKLDKYKVNDLTLKRSLFYNEHKILLLEDS